MLSLRSRCALHVEGSLVYNCARVFGVIAMNFAVNSPWQEFGSIDVNSSRSMGYGGNEGDALSQEQA